MIYASIIKSDDTYGHLWILMATYPLWISRNPLHISQIFRIFASWKHRLDQWDEWNWRKPISRSSHHEQHGKNSSFSCRITKNCQRFLPLIIAPLPLHKCRPSSATWAPLSALFALKFFPKGKSDSILRKIKIFFKQTPRPLRGVKASY